MRTATNVSRRKASHTSSKINYVTTIARRSNVHRILIPFTLRGSK